MSVILALWRWRQSWSKLEVRQGYIVSPSLKQAEKAQSVKCLLPKHYDTSSIPLEGTWQAKQYLSVIPAPGRCRQVDPCNLMASQPT